MDNHSKNFAVSLTITVASCYIFFNICLVVLELIFSRYSAFLQFNLNLETFWAVIVRGQYMVIPLVILSVAIIHLSRWRAISTAVIILFAFILWPLYGGISAVVDYIFFGLLPIWPQILLVIFCTVLFALVFRWLEKHRSSRFKTVSLLSLVIFVAFIGVVPVVRARSIFNAEECVGSTEYMRYCRLSVAQKTRDLDLCVRSSMPNSPTEGLSAFAILKRSNLYGSDYLTCVNSVWADITATGNVRCGDFSDVRSRDICIYRNAVASKDSVMCNQLTDDELRNSCMEELSATAGAGTISCAGITDIAQGQKCFTDAAIRLRDTSLCQRLPILKEAENLRPDAVNRCISVVARTNKQISFCDEISSGSSNDDVIKAGAVEIKQSCFASIGNNSAPCEVIPRTDGKSMCLTQAARDNGNLKICDISRDKWRCYMEVAVAKNDGSVCKLILDDSFKNSCETSLRYPVPALR